MTVRSAKHAAAVTDPESAGFVLRFFKPFLLKAHDALFAHMRRTGLVLMAVDAEDGTLVIDEQPDDEAAEDDESKEGDDEGAGAEGEGEEPAEAEEVDAEADEVVISLGDEPAPEEDDKRAPEWVRDLRKSNRELVRRQRELEAENARLKGSAGGQPAAVVVGEKPTMEGCDFDAEKFERDLEAWHTRKREADEQQRKQKQTEEQQQAQWQGRIDSVKKAATTLKVKDYDDAAQVFEDSFAPIQQAIILDGPDDPKTSALLRYALGKNPKKAKELAGIQNPVKFAFAVAKLEAKLKVTPRKQAPTPDKVVRSSVAGAAAVDNELERLRKEAEKTGDLSKVFAYRQQQRAKQRA
jgi:hypothetical protein